MFVHIPEAAHEGRKSSLMKKSLIAPLLVLSFLVSGGCASGARVHSPPAIPSLTTGRIIRVVDGDTVELEDGRKVRLIGIDTPELHHPTKPVMFFAEEAFQFTRRLVEDRDVRVEYDQERTDKYGRTLAYLYLSDGTFVNAEIVRQGYGLAYTRFPFRYKEDFKKYEQEARERERGLWKVLVGDPETSHIIYLYQSLDESHREQARRELEELVATKEKGGGQ